MKHSILTIVFTFFTLVIFAQSGVPEDYLNAEFHKERRDGLRAKMADNSVAVFFANPVRNRANDVDYVYHQDPDFYYLTGYKEPHAVLVVFKEDQTNDTGDTFNEVIYVQERNPRAEQWTGKRLGTEGAKKDLGFDIAYNGSEFEKSGIDFGRFNKVMFYNFNNDYRDSKGNNADLFSLVETFKTQANYDDSLLEDPIKNRVYEMIKATEIENSANVAQMISQAFEYYPNLKEDKIIAGYVNATDDNTRIELKQQVIKIEQEEPKSNLDTNSLASIMASLRQVKTEEEMVLLTKAIRISAMGQREIMKAMHPGMSELEIQGINEYV